MTGWTVAAALFAAGALGIGLWQEYVRIRDRPRAAWSFQRTEGQDGNWECALVLWGEQDAHRVRVEHDGCTVWNLPPADVPHMSSGDRLEFMLMPPASAEDLAQAWVQIRWHRPPIRRMREGKLRWQLSGDVGSHQDRKIRREWQRSRRLRD